MRIGFRNPALRQNLSQFQGQVRGKLTILGRTRGRAPDRPGRAFELVQDRAEVVLSRREQGKGFGHSSFVRLGV
jgi:hypothetical protein